LCSSAAFSHAAKNSEPPGKAAARLARAIRSRRDVNISLLCPNLFLCDGSSLVSSSRQQPTATIQALAYRAAEHIAALARRKEI